MFLPLASISENWDVLNIKNIVGKYQEDISHLSGQHTSCDGSDGFTCIIAQIVLMIICQYPKLEYSFRSEKVVGWNACACVMDHRHMNQVID
jgi:hypothetical protein